MNDSEQDWLPELTGVIRLAQKRGYAHTDFLDPAMRVRLRHEAAHCGLVVHENGGWTDAERTLASVYREGEESLDILPRRLAVRWDKRFSGAPEHRQVLGAILGTGIERSKVGDILLNEDRGNVFVHPDLADYVCMNCDRCGRIPVHVEPETEEEPLPLPSVSVMQDTAASLRLDCLVAACAGLSRDKAASLVHSERVKVNHILCAKGDRTLQVGDLISVAGKGRFRLIRVEQTQKGRFRVFFEK